MGVSTGEGNVFLVPAVVLLHMHRPAFPQVCACEHTSSPKISQSVIPSAACLSLNVGLAACQILCVYSLHVDRGVLVSGGSVSSE